MTTMEAAPSVWSDAMLAASLFAIDPVGLGGVAVRSAPGPARDLWLAQMQALAPVGAPFRRVPVRIEDDRLLGGLDLATSLAAGRPIVDRGVLAACDGGMAILSMAERMDGALGARLASVLDTGEVAIEREGLTTRLPVCLGLIALDEGVEPTERPPEALLDRLAFRIDLTSVSAREGREGFGDPSAIAEAKLRTQAVAPATDAVLQALCETSALLGLNSPRSALLALRTARAHAGLEGRTEISDEDVLVAVRLVLLPRALVFPEDSTPESDHQAPEPPPPSDLNERPATDQNDVEKNQDLPSSDTETLIAAIQASLPEGLLESVRMAGSRSLRSNRGQGSGASVKSVQRGRPVGSRRGAWRGGDRLNLPETLRAATPWQRLRPALSGEVRIQVRQEDFRIRRFVQRQEATTIFLVDASGSAAFQRLAEAKGAVELLLAKAYVSRTRVALIAFRNKGAELLLEPTRSLTRAKRSLADLPGGGGTPLAAGLEAACLMARAEKAKNHTPTIVVLTDGRTNIGRSGAPGRAGAESDAMEAARTIRDAAIGAVFIDTSPRTQPDGDRFARAMGAVYAPLPYVDAGAVVGLMDGLRSTVR